jgi:UDP-3-O-acyl N-acetylglucosamine deacetylase
MNKGRILIVDDQAEILASLGSILLEEGHEVLTASDGQEALHIVQSDAPDVVFLDIWIPGIDGMQTLRAIKRIAPLCSVIMMSGHGTIETAVKAIKLGAADYLEKPLNLEDVLHLVQRAILAKVDKKGIFSNNNKIPGQILGKSHAASELRELVTVAASHNDSVWLLGDEGTGKEFVARVLHHLSGNDRSGLGKIRCNELNADNIREVLLNKISELSRANSVQHQGSSGTLLLIRVDRLDPVVMADLARLIAELRDFHRTGINGTNQVRIVSTAVVSPSQLFEQHGLKTNLENILGRTIIRIPSLDERRLDIPVLVEHFLREAVEEFDREIVAIEEDAMRRLMDYPWPGNIKELKILMEHVVMTAPGPTVTVNDLLIPIAATTETVYPEIGAVPDLGHQPASSRKAVELDLGLARSLSPSASKAGPSTDVLQQKTLRGRVVMYGQGLHSGQKTGLTLSPLPPSAGILFGHITSGGTVQALLDNVESTDFSTSLRRNGSPAKTIEHLMAVFHVYGLTNVLVKISGEVPIMDGSALEFCKLVEDAEIITQEETIEEVRITRPIELSLSHAGGKSMRVEPSDCLEVEYFMDYPPPVGSMNFSFRCEGAEQFKESIAPARTFGFVRDMRMMDEMGLAGGGRLSNVVLLDDDKVVNPPLRYPDEFVRHKILDIIGDFYLFGRPFVGKITAKQTGHTENIAMLRLINQELGIL